MSKIGGRAKLTGPKKGTNSNSLPKDAQKQDAKNVCQAQGTSSEDADGSRSYKPILYQLRKGLSAPLRALHGPDRVFGKSLMVQLTTGSGLSAK